MAEEASLRARKFQEPNVPLPASLPRVPTPSEHIVRTSALLTVLRYNTHQGFRGKHCKGPSCMHVELQCTAENAARA